MTLTKINSPRVNGKGLQKAVVLGYIVLSQLFQFLCAKIFMRKVRVKVFFKISWLLFLKMNTQMQTYSKLRFES